MGGKENGEKERDGASGTRAVVGKAKEEEECGMEQGALRSDEGEMGESQKGGQIEVVVSIVRQGAMLVRGVGSFGLGRRSCAMEAGTRATTGGTCS